VPPVVDALPTALVVEDDPDIQEVVCDVLADDGYAPLAASDLRTAREHLASRNPVVVYLDLMLGQEWGGDLLAELAHANDSPAVLLASASLEADSLAKRYGVNLLRKPFDIDTLLERVREAHRMGRRPTPPPV
jgi:DNA-binding response OmpR family regulator